MWWSCSLQFSDLILNCVPIHIIRVNHIWVLSLAPIHLSMIVQIRFVLNGSFKLHIRLLLNGLCVLKFLNQLHFEQLHFHNFLFFCGNETLFFFNLSLLLNASLHDLAAFGLFKLLFRNLFLNTLRLFHVVISLGSIVHVGLVALLIFHSFNFGFVSLLLPMHLDGSLNLLFFLLIGVLCVFVPLSSLLLLKLVHLHLFNFTLNSFIVSLFKTHHVTSTLFSFFNLFPRPHLFLFEQRNTISQQLSVTLNIDTIFFSVKSAFSSITRVLTALLSQ